MRKIFVTLLFAAFFNQINAQAPQALNYQAVARTAAGVVIPSQSIAVRFSVLDGSVTGTALYTETHQTTTNAYGLFTLLIGKGTAGTGTFTTINWASGTDKFLKVEIDAAGGTNYQIQGTTQLLSVPFALYAEKTKLLAGNNTVITNGNTITGNYQAANNTILLAGNTIAGNYQPANNTVVITGNQIGGNYQPANNTVTITGNQIGGNYQAANNTVSISGNLIGGNYQAGTGINISGNNISGNYQAGTGISITGNTITNTRPSLWTQDANGINYQLGSVGIGTPSEATQKISILATNTPSLLRLRSSDSWQSALILSNISGDPLINTITFSIGGITNTAQKPGNFGIYNNRLTSWLMNFDNTRNYVAFGNDLEAAIVPRSRVHVLNGDVNIDQIGSGIILKSPNGQCWRVTIDNTGNLIRTAIICP